MPSDANPNPAQAPRYPAVEREMRIANGDHAVPTALWMPAGASSCPLLLVGHGGSGDRRSSFVRDLVPLLVEPHGFAIAAIDGPVHGARRAAPAEPLVVRDEFRELWERGDSVDGMVADWLCVMKALSALPGIDAARIGYYGLSMGTAYGLPFLAQAPGVRAAVIGMWGTSRAHGARLAQAARQVRCPIIFSLQWQDEIFTREGQFELFEALAGDDKSVSIHPGGHVNPAGRRLDEIAAFLVRQLSA